MIALLITLVMTCGPAWCDEQTADVVYLKDGTELRGLIVEQEPGISVKLASVDGAVWTLEDREIDIIEKQPSAEPLPVQYTDVVLLKDGVLFRGTVVEQRPGESLTLRTAAGPMLRIPSADVWKLAKRKEVVGTAASAEESAADAGTEPLRIRLQIEIAGQALPSQSEAEAKVEGATAAPSAGGSDSAALEREREKADQEALNDDRSAEHSALRGLEKEVEQLVGELLEDLEQCEEEQGGQSSEESISPYQWVSYQPVKAGDTEPVRDVTARLTKQLGEIVDRTLAKIPNNETIVARQQQADDSRTLQGLLSTGRQAGRLDLGRVSPLVDRLPSEERQRLFEVNQRRDALSGALLNLVPFLYAGSWSQGDTSSALLGHLVFAAAGAVDLALLFTSSVPTPVETPWGWTEMWNDPSGWVFWVGPACYLAAYVVGIVLPPLRAGSWNASLAEALRLGRREQHSSSEPTIGLPSVALLPDANGRPRVAVKLLSLEY